MHDRPVRILTSIPGVPGRFWGDNTTLVSEKSGELMYGNLGFISRQMSAVCIAIQLLIRARRFDVVVLDGGPVGQWYSWVAALNPLSMPPALMVDCLWYRESSWWKRLIKKGLKKLSACSISKFAVWARHEIVDYSVEFGITSDKFIYVPFHITLEDYDFETSDKGFVFAGGNGDRDYRTLVEAVRGLDIQVLIGANDKRLFEGIDLPHNVTVQGFSPDDFRRKMASCRIAVVPMQAGLLHSGGQQTFLNSMYMGKPTIVVGQKVADGYLEDGVNGLVVDYGDVAGLRRAIISLYEDSLLRERLGEAGQTFASQFTTDVFVKALYSLAANLAAEKILEYDQ